MLVRKSSLALHLAALALTGCGWTLHGVGSLVQVLFSLILTVLLVGSVYGFNDLLDLNLDLRKTEKLWFCFWITATIGGLFLSPQYLGLNASIAALIIFTLGLTYSFRVFQNRLKNIFVLKNLLIATGWVLLLYLSLSKTASLKEDFLIHFGIQLFVFIQIFIGSVIRDMTDLYEDKVSGVNTFPIKLGFSNTNSLLQLLNVISFVLVLAQDVVHRSSLSGLILIPVIWRWLVLREVNKNLKNSFWPQTANLFTCTLIFIAVSLRG